MINPRKTKSVKYLGDIDISSLRDDILSIPESVWNQENESKPNRFKSLDSTQHIVFRFINTMHDWRASHDRPLWNTWRSKLEPILQQATAPYGYVRGDYPRVMLAKMAPGGIIKTHVDNGPAAAWPHKIHIPIQTNEHTKFYIDPETYHFKEGQAVEVNNIGRHGVRNEGDTDRIHLIFEYYDMDQPVE